MEPQEFDVLVVGAGPAGLTTAAGLARAGVRVLVVDKHAGTSIFPKAAGVRPRTMEILRSWGLEERVRAGGQDVRLEMAGSPVLSGPVFGVESLGVPDADRLAAVTPCPFAFVPQDALEPVLADHVREHGGKVRFRTELLGFDLADNGVRAVLRPRDGGAVYEVAARYLVGADGPRSGIRDALGIEVERLGSEGSRASALFTADLDGVLPDPPYALHWVTAPGVEGTFVAAGRHRWTYGWVTGSLDDPLPPDEWVVQRVRAAAGLPELHLDLLGVFAWDFGAEVATSFRSGPVFLVGDAATRTSPRGATGMNTGMAAAHNLAWKLAWVLRGWADEALLDTYEAERLPVGRANARGSLLSIDELRAAPEHVELDVTYASSAVAGTEDEDETIVAGQRAPHAWTRVDGHRVSTLDLFDGRLTLLTGPGGADWCAAADRLAATGVPLTALRFGPDLADPDGSVTRRFGVDRGGAVLVRPDGHVAWRTGAVAAADAAAALGRAIDAATGRAGTRAVGDGRARDAA